MGVEIHLGDALATLKRMPEKQFQACITSPPYWGLRDYGTAGQLGLEKNVHEYIDKLVVVFDEVRRVMRDDGTLWLNVGDSYACSPGGNQGKTGERANRRFTSSGRIKKQLSVPKKNIIGIPWKLAFALQNAGWILRQDIIWHKKNPVPESVKDRFTRAHEYIFFFSKKQKYYFDQTAIREQAAGCTDGLTRNKRSVWSTSCGKFKGKHFATFPEALIEPCVNSSCPPGGKILDPFFGAGTTGLVCAHHQRDCVGIEINPIYAEMARRRIFLESKILPNFKGEYHAQ